MAGAQADPATNENWSETAAEMTAHGVRSKHDSYLANVEFLRPQAATTARELEAINPSLTKLLPGLGAMIDEGEVSPLYKQLYDRKVRQLRAGYFPTNHNFLDCETAMNLKHSESGRKVFLLQADMDVVTDGTDPVRKPHVEDYDFARGSNSFLPITKYGWYKGSEPKNPFIDYYPEALKELQEVRADLAKRAEADKGVIWRRMLETCDEQIQVMKGRGNGSSIQSWMKNSRYLLATEDPFVVLPMSWFKDANTPGTGDLCAVVYKNRIYPAILGDSGPDTKVGEASIKLAKQLNSEASGTNRAINSVGVTYLFFPGSKLSSGNLDYAEWRERVVELLGEIGGVSSANVVHTW
ncbi:MAG: hypothetical protein HRU46_21510 [Verrucomicrobiales bacterium]|nr:hypothetical protein [Verrucomicrobiales bacterium]